MNINYIITITKNLERPILEGPDTALTIDEALNMLLVIYNETYPYKEQIDVSISNFTKFIR